MTTRHDHQGRTHRLELDDQSLRDWDALVLDVNEDGIVLDRSAFYPGGGGQPPDPACCSGAEWSRVLPVLARTTTSGSSRLRATRCRRSARRYAARWTTSAAPG